MRLARLFAPLLATAIVAGGAAPANAQVMGSSQLPPLPAIQLPVIQLPTFQLPPLPAGSSVPGVTAAPIIGNALLDPVLAELNARRVAAGLQPFTYDFGLGETAYNHAVYLNNIHTMDHSGLFMEVIARVPDLGMAVPMWIDSPPHHEVLMDGTLSRVGFGLVFDQSEGRWILVAQFT
ncbi:CAP domain-containing protein [Corynebacterium hindlerae]|uniref:CAP domain-containing protein n=1 Tax=Corynebacterium hindlerae TaxID=699041 RepID=UPI001AD64945|nr:CAP domain-containing protein [Corynebacterium hindlerae]QTH59371.1 CAP domain-containing protein [Corynebacterium hindlerae]